jgi:putative membrane protein
MYYREYYMKHALMICSLALLNAGCAATDTGTAANMPSGDLPTAAPTYVAMAGSSDLYEIESSRLALQRTQRPAVRQFAQMMIDHHTMTTQQVMGAAQAAGMTPPPPTLLPPQQAMLDQLQPANGADFDRMYIEQQRTAHRVAYDLHSNYARNGDTPQLRQVATNAVPVIQRHIDALRSL